MGNMMKANIGFLMLIVGIILVMSSTSTEEMTYIIIQGVLGLSLMFLSLKLLGVKR